MLSVSDCGLPTRLNTNHKVEDFDCQRDFMNEFLKEKAAKYIEQRLCVVHVFSPENNPALIAGYFTLSADSIQIDVLRLSKRQREKEAKRIGMPHLKRHLRTYPAVKIGMLAVNKPYVKKGFGREMLDVIKIMVDMEDGPYCCRHIIIDAVNEEPILRFYRDNGFGFLYKTEDEEKEAMGEDEGPRDKVYAI